MQGLEHTRQEILPLSIRKIKMVYSEIAEFFFLLF
jgi:hypothetical protein